MKSMYSRMKEGEITRYEYNNWWAKNKGYKDYNEYNNLWVKSKGYKNRNDYMNQWAISKGYKNLYEYYNFIKQQSGYKDNAEYQRELSHSSERHLSISENKECSSYLGIHVAERVLSKIFNNVTRMPNKNKGYDFICGKGFKIDVKSSCLCWKVGIHPYYTFVIKKNKIADYFLLLAFDNRENLNPRHLWLIKSGEVIVSKNYYGKLSDRITLSIPSSKISIERFKKYEQSDKLENMIKCCDNLKDN